MAGLLQAQRCCLPRASWSRAQPPLRAPRPQRCSAELSHTRLRAGGSGGELPVPQPFLPGSRELRAEPPHPAQTPSSAPKASLQRDSPCQNAPISSRNRRRSRTGVLTVCARALREQPRGRPGGGAGMSSPRPPRRRWRHPDLRSPGAGNKSSEGEATASPPEPPCSLPLLCAVPRLSVSDAT